MKTPLLIFLFNIVLVIYSCSSAISSNKELESFVEHIEKRSSKMSEKDWLDADKKIETLQNKIESNNNLNDLDRANANKLIGKYARIKIKSNLKNLEKEIKGFSDKINGMVDELVDTSTY